MRVLAGPDVLLIPVTPKCPATSANATAKALSHVPPKGLGLFISAAFCMRSFKYRCPNTGALVQGWLADEPVEADAETYRQVTCNACGRTHMVNPKTGKVLGAPIK